MASTHHRELNELPISIDRRSDVSLPSQIAAALREAIDRRALRAGEPVPATRDLSHRLGVARGVVVSAYEQLISEGYLSANHGRGTRVHPELSTEGLGSERSDFDTDSKAVDQLAAVQKEPLPLVPGLPDTSAVGTPQWRAAWKRAAAQGLEETADLGNPILLDALSEHLRRMRGTTRPASDIIVTAGAREGLSLLLSALGTTRGRSLKVGVEDPGYPSLRRVAARHGAQIIALPVDGEGLITDHLPHGMLDAVLVTPSHQYPLGGSLSLARRRQLIAWAQRTGAVIIEDDYDSELRHSGTPLPTLAALDNRRSGSVALLGTFSKTVSQALSAGFMLLPENLFRVVAPVRKDFGGPVSAIVQSALAEYLASGELRRHTTRMRRKYAMRRELVVERLFGATGIQIRPMNGGLHAVIEMIGGSHAAEQDLYERTAHLGPVPLSGYWHTLNTEGRRFGLVIGTGGNTSEQLFEAALRELRDAIEDSAKR